MLLLLAECQLVVLLLIEVLGLVKIDPRGMIRLLFSTVVRNNLRRWQ